MDLFEGLPDPQSHKEDNPSEEPETCSNTIGKNSLLYLHTPMINVENPANSASRTSLIPGIDVINISHSPLENPSEPGKRKADPTLISSNAESDRRKYSRCEDTVPSSLAQTLVSRSQECAMRLNFSGFLTEMQGEREEMEDQYVLMDSVNDSRILQHSEVLNVSFYGVFDGHNGSRASQYVAAALLDAILHSFVSRGGSTTKDLDAAIVASTISAYKSIDTSFLSKASVHKPPWKDGTTATTALIINNRAYFANVGDSKAILCRYDNDKKGFKAVTLTVDHSPTLYEERQRIQQQGGFVKEGRLNGILEVSRSLGDFPYKKGSGLICTPSIHKCIFTPDDRFIVVACDGIWKALSPSEVIKLVLQMVETAREDQVETLYAAASVALAKEAVKRLSGDNVTVIIVRIKQTQSTP